VEYDTNDIFNSFETERTSARPLNLDDCAFILELVNTKGWLSFIGDRNIHSETDARFYVQRMLDNPDITYWVVRLREKTIPIGIITLIQREYLDFFDIGFAFLPEYTHQGYAFESSALVLSSLLNSGEYPVILATTIPQNTDSVKLLSKLNFNFEKEISINKEVLHLYRVSRNIDNRY
jgi:RimJ/RimL family protein N-acetyltransferase